MLFTVIGVVAAIVSVFAGLFKRKRRSEKVPAKAGKAPVRQPATAVRARESAPPVESKTVPQAPVESQAPKPKTAKRPLADKAHEDEPRPAKAKKPVRKKAPAKKPAGKKAAAKKAPQEAFHPGAQADHRQQAGGCEEGGNSQGRTGAAGTGQGAGGRKEAGGEAAFRPRDEHSKVERCHQFKKNFR